MSIHGPEQLTRDGMFFPLSSVRDVTDGLSNTVLGGEIVSAAAASDVRGNYWTCTRGGCLMSTFHPPNTPVGDRLDEPPSISTQCVEGPLAPCLQTVGADDPWSMSARSHHAGGAHVVMGDGAVRFASENISREVFQALGGRNDGKVAGF